MFHQMNNKLIVPFKIGIELDIIELKCSDDVKKIQKIEAEKEEE